MILPQKDIAALLEVVEDVKLSPIIEDISKEEVNKIVDEVGEEFYQLKVYAKDWTKKAISFFDYLDGLFTGKTYIGSYELLEIKKRLKEIQDIRNNL